MMELLIKYQLSNYCLVVIIYITQRPQRKYPRDYLRQYDITISYVKGTLNKAADGLSRAHDDGLTRYDDLVTARHPALGLLKAPKLKEGEVLPINDYLTKCEDYLTDHWPKVLKDYESQCKAEGNTPDLECFKPKVDIVPQRLSNLAKTYKKK